MGVTIESKKYSIDLGYGGFMNLRKKVADLTSEVISKHYRELESMLYTPDDEYLKLRLEQYDRKTSEIYDTSDEDIQGALRFLYASDCEATISVKDCVCIYQIIKDYDDNICYGYAGRKDCAMFKDFKELVKDCIETKTDMTWF